MNAAEIIQVLEKLAIVGATKFKCPSLEVELGSESKTIEQPKASPVPEINIPYSPENTSKTQALIDLLKLKDEELVNKIFPDGA